MGPRAFFQGSGGESGMWALHLTGGSINTLQTMTKTRCVCDTSSTTVTIQSQLQSINMWSFRHPKLLRIRIIFGIDLHINNKLMWCCFILMHSGLFYHYNVGMLYVNEQRYISEPPTHFAHCCTNYRLYLCPPPQTQRVSPLSRMEGGRLTELIKL